jgi:hypothetical protein
MFLNKDDVKALISSSINDIKKELKKENDVLNERMIYLEKRNQHLEQQNQHLEQKNLNLNTFIEYHLERLDRNIAENHQYILNNWNPFMQSTIEGVKNDLIQAMNNNKKDDELSKRVDTLAIQVSDLNKIVVDEGYVNIVFKYGNQGSLNFIPIKKNIEVFDLFDKDIYFYDYLMNYKLGSNGTNQVNFYINQINLFPKLKKINLTKMLNTYFPTNKWCKDTSIKHVCIMLNEIVDKDWIYDLYLEPFGVYEESHNHPNDRLYLNDCRILMNKKIDILKKYIQTNFPHIEII